MLNKETLNKEAIVIILIGIIVLLGVYIITSQNKPIKQVTFSVPEVSREIVFERDYPDYGSLNTPTLFNPSGSSSPMFFQQMFFDTQATNFQPLEQVQPTSEPRQEFRLMNLRSPLVQNPTLEGISSVDIIPHSELETQDN